jgi:hypothetical protein
MKPQQMEPGSGDEHTELLNELQRIEYQMRGAVAAGVKQLVQELPAGTLRQALQGQGWAQQVPAQMLELLAGVGRQGDVGVQ